MQILLWLNVSAPGVLNFAVFSASTFFGDQVDNAIFQAVAQTDEDFSPGTYELDVS